MHALRVVCSGPGARSARTLGDVLLVRILLGPLVLLAFAVLATPPSSAQSWNGPNGGQMVDAGSFHVELVVKDADYSVSVFDHVDNPVAVANATAVATVMVGEQKEKVTLQPAAANTLIGTGSMKRAGLTKILVLLRLPDQATAMARFEVP
jgi:hypothetical protein